MAQKYVSSHPEPLEGEQGDEAGEKYPAVDDVKGCGGMSRTPDDVKGAGGNLQSAAEARNL
jgi:hypothetical protein